MQTNAKEIKIKSFKNCPKNKKMLPKWANALTRK